MYTAAIIAVVLAAFFYASYSIRSGVYVKAHCRGRRERKAVALTFDDGPHPERTPRVLDVLERHGVKAAFFVAGDKVRQYPQIVERMAREGHIVGNHTYAHSPRFPLYGARRMEEEMRRCDDEVERATGSRPALFRPPYGVTNPMVAAAVRARGYKVVGWDVRSLDTLAGRPREKVFDRVRRKLRGGSVILLHDDREQSDVLLEMILGHLEETGYSVERIDELLEL